MNSFIDTYITSGYGLNLQIFIGIYILSALGLHLTFGLGGLFNLAHVAIYAIGAYATALLATPEYFELGFFQCLLVSALLCGLFSLLLGAISLRLSGDYFAIGTLAFSSIITALLINWRSLTKGVLGIPGIPKPEIWGVSFMPLEHFLGLLYIFVIIFIIIFAYFNNGTFARLLKAQAENPHCVSVLGWNVSLIKNIAFVLSAMLTGIAGSFFAYHMSYIDPSSFSLHEMVFILTIIIIGKPGSLSGLILATIFLVLLPELVNKFELPSQYIGPVRQLMYAVVLFTVVFWNRAKLFPEGRRI